MKKIITIALLILLVSCQTTDKKEEKLNPLYNLATRLLGEDNANKFIFERTDSTSTKDEFEISSIDGKILIKGNSNVALASGLNWYLKYYANTSISWETKQINLPDKLPVPDKPVTKKSPFEYSYYLNYCTFNYSMAFWDWERWEKEIDWMALNGINLPLAIVGTEFIWEKTLERLNFTQTEIKDFIPGPGFNAWWLMGNLEGWGGPVSDAYIQQQLTLQKKILSRMEELGMKPVLPGFYGMVPNILKSKYPDADIRDQGLWAGGFTRPAFLSPNDSLFNTVAQIYYEELKKTFKNIEYFSGDPFHEGGSTKGIDLPDAGKNIISAMHNFFPEATWVFQGWQSNPKEALLQKIKGNDVLILDLDCAREPQWEYRKGWDQKPWLWNAIINFGANVGLFGRMDAVAEEPFRAFHLYPGNMKGIGAMMEGIENNYVIYELLLELKWYNEKVNLDQWLSDYAERRYGQTNENINNAWQILRNTVYGAKFESEQAGPSESILCARPSLEIDRASSWGTSKLYYDPANLLEAWTLFAEEADKLKDSEGFRYDFLDITRQVLSNYAHVIYNKMISAYNNNNKKDFKEASERFLNLLDDQDSLLSSDEHFMLGKWISEARKRGTTREEQDLFEYNARTQITTWSFKDSDLHEYAHKEWSGLLSDFYKPRWEMFIEYIGQIMDGKKTQEPLYYSFEEAWTKRTNSFPSKALRNPVEECLKTYKDYFPKINHAYTTKNK